MDISKHYDELVRCNRCGFCQAACPVFRATGHEEGVARGRLALLRALVEGRLPWSRELEEPLFACLLCEACTAHCFPAVETADLVRAARAEYLERVGRKKLHRLLFRHLLPYPRRLRLAARAVALGKRTGASKLAKALGLLRCLGRDLPKAEAIVERFPPRALRETIEPGTLEGQGGAGRIAYFVGCGMDIMCPRAAEATLGLLRRLAASVVVLDNVCCGLPAETYGDRQAARELAERNLELLDAQEVDGVVTDCSSCAAFLKSYPRLFAEGDPQRRKAEQAAARVRDLLELAHELPRPRAGRPLVVTYHDPCHASRGQGLRAEPRERLGALPGVEYRELPEADWCCGGAGSYALGHYELSRQVLDRKMENVAATGAEVLATSCPACIVQLSYGVRLHGLPVRVCHLSELLAGQPAAASATERTGGC
ncbi:MAG: (Fe-S)-binding protein [Candidatus Brocadiia bacterium]